MKNFERQPPNLSAAMGNKNKKTLLHSRLFLFSGINHFKEFFPPFSLISFPYFFCFIFFPFKIKRHLFGVVAILPIFICQVEPTSSGDPWKVEPYRLDIRKKKSEKKAKATFFFFFFFLLEILVEENQRASFLSSSSSLSSSFSFSSSSGNLRKRQSHGGSAMER